MLENHVAIIVRYKGDFVIGEDEWEYDGGQEGTIIYDIRKPSYVILVRDINYYFHCKAQKLHYCIPDQGLKEGLRFFDDDNGVKDIIYFYLHGKEPIVYVEEYIEDEGDDDGDGEDEVDESTRIEGGDGTEATVEGGNGSVLEERPEEEDTLTDIGADWEVAASSSSDDDIVEEFGLLGSDDDDEELEQSRKILREARPSTVAAGQSSALEGTQSDYAESDGATSAENEVGEEGAAHPQRRTSKYPIYDPKVVAPVLTVGMKFDDAKQFKEAVVKSSVAAQRSIEFVRNTKEFVRAKCSHPSCGWKIYGAFGKKTKSFQLRTMQEEHTCSIRFQNKRVTSVWLAKHFFETIKAMPNINLSRLRILVKEQLGVNVSRNQCKRAKHRVMLLIMSKYKDEYAKVWEYAFECRLQNPDSRITTEVVERPLPEVGTKFDRLYVCFEACRRGFVAGCRRIIGLDGCFLKGFCKGEVLAAVGRDANNQMYPLAWAVVKIENKDTWTWFLKNLMADLDINDGGGWAFMSDQQKGLVPAMTELMPYAEHRMCARHIYANWAKNFKGEKLQRQFWQIAKSTNMADFRIAKQGLLELTKEGFDALFKTEPKHWCRAFFSEEFKCDIIDNNLSEAFNGRIVEARCKPIISMLEDIRVMVMTRLHTQRDASVKWANQCGPRIMKKLDDNLNASRFCHPIWNGDDGFEVMHHSDTYVVQLERRKCSCRAWQVSGIPCAHAICAIQSRQQNPEDYIDKWYTKEMYVASYQFMMQPIRSIRFWEPTNHEAPVPLPLKKKMGRPKKRRRKHEGEVSRSTVSRFGYKMTCSYCQEEGHNKKGCHLKRNIEQQLPTEGPVRQQGEETIVTHSTLEQGSTNFIVTRKRKAQHTVGAGIEQIATEPPQQLRRKISCRRRKNAQEEQGEGPTEQQPNPQDRVQPTDEVRATRDEEPEQQPTGQDRDRDLTTENVVEQTEEPTKKVTKRGKSQRIAESNLPRRTRGAMGKKIKQYGYGIYSDERTGMTILHPGRSSEVLLSIASPTDEARAAPSSVQRPQTRGATRGTKTRDNADARPVTRGETLRPMRRGEAQGPKMRGAARGPKTRGAVRGPKTRGAARGPKTRGAARAANLRMPAPVQTTTEVPPETVETSPHEEPHEEIEGTMQVETVQGREFEHASEDVNSEDEEHHAPPVRKSVRIMNQVRPTKGQGGGTIEID